MRTICNKPTIGNTTSMREDIAQILGLEKNISHPFVYRTTKAKRS